MRIVSTIDRPLRDEHVLAVDPPLRPELPGVWRRRINPFGNRALTAAALTAEQEVRAGVQLLRGQSVTSGVVSGLDLLLEPGSETAAKGDAVVQILPGFGLARSGEDVTIGSPRQIALGELPIYARVDRLDAAGLPPSDDDPDHGGDPTPPPGGAFAALPMLRPRRYGPTLRAAIAAGADLPRVAILVAEPVTAEIVGRGDPASSCPRDPRDDPYDDWERVDGCRLILAFWPDDLVAVNAPDYAMPAAGPSLRNRLAYRVFEIERHFLRGEAHPWEWLGVPLGLVVFKPDWTLDFIDRSAVVRLGGSPNPRTSPVAGAGAPVLWQARLSQLVEHYGVLADLAPATLAAALRRLPPVGLLPRDVIDLQTRRQTFFPPGFTLTAAPAPLEHLNLVVGESASLDPISLEVPEEVELLVPVPERVYEPGLLETAVVDPEFARTIGRFISDRTEWLTRRELVRRRRDVLTDAIEGRRPKWRADDATEAERLPEPDRRAPVTSTRVRRTTGLHDFTGAGSSLEIAAGDRICQWVLRDAAVTGIGLMLSELEPPREAAPTATYPYRRFWGSGAPMVADTPVDLRRQGDLPQAGRWTRLEASADAIWSVDGAKRLPLAGHRITAIRFFQNGGTVEWGPLSKIDSAGNETLFVADDAPAGATLHQIVGTNGWNWVPAGPGDLPVESEFGTTSPESARRAAPLDGLRDRWPQTFLARDFNEIQESGVDGFAASIEAKIRTTNDAIDLGFVRARADIYRVRQYILGADVASRLVTSPSLADVAVREESARARGEQIHTFLQAAKDVSVTPAPGSGSTTGGARGGTPAAPGSATPQFMAFSLNNAMVSGAAPSAFRAAPAGESVLARYTSYTTEATSTPMMFVAPQYAPTGIATVAGTGFTQSAGTTFLQQSRGTTSIAGLYSGTYLASPGVRDIQAQQPLVGYVDRTVSVAERLKESPAVEAHRYALAGKRAVRDSLAKLIKLDENQRRQGIAVGDLIAPGYQAKTPPSPMREPTLDEVIKNPSDFDDLDDNVAAGPSGLHESDYFGAAVQALDNAIAMMRLVEGRIELYNRLLADARSVHGELQAHIGEADARLRAIGVELEEARHDVGVAQALLAEEQARVDALNARRTAILNAHVKAVLFRRPRVADRFAVAPTAAAAAALVEAPAVACQRMHPAVPEELRAFATGFREAPLRWFPGLHAHLGLIDRLDVAQAAVTAVRLRAETAIMSVVRTPAGAPKFVAAMGAAFAAQRIAFEPRRMAALQLDVAHVATIGIVAARQRLIDTASLGDLIDPAHGRPDLGRHASVLLDAIAQVAACLHDGFGDVLPIARLEWAEMLSEFDRPAPLRSLAGLPRWGEVPIDLRRKQQGLVDWLFANIDGNIAEAEAAMNELVRVCILMAAHAPVDRIVSARLVAPVLVRIGARLDLALSAGAVRIGMTVLARATDDRLVARAVVDDISDGVARARITHAIDASAVLTVAAQIHLTDLAGG